MMVAGVMGGGVMECFLGDELFMSRAKDCWLCSSSYSPGVSSN